LSITSHQLSTDNSDERMTGAEHAPENEELSRSVLGLIAAYRMGSSLDAQDLFPSRTSASDSVLATSA
jgi:hypothetical protein